LINTEKQNHHAQTRRYDCHTLTQPEQAEETKIYSLFFHQFMPCVTNNGLFDCQVNVATNDATLSTISDETFALLLLKNSVDHWVHIFQSQVTTKRGTKKWNCV
jgi:hypothetical protein